VTVKIEMDIMMAEALFLHLMDGDPLDNNLRIEAFGKIADAIYEAQIEGANV
jgi:hypothetical protein